MSTIAVSQLLKDRSEMAVDADLNEEAGFEEERLVCSYVKCGRVISEPVRLTNLSRSPNVETYYACPYCFSKLDIEKVFDDTKNFGVKRDRTAKKGADAKLDKYLNVPACTHHLGYLKNRPSNATIPDECLTCPKVLKCMV